MSIQKLNHFFHQKLYHQAIHYYQQHKLTQLQPIHLLLLAKAYYSQHQYQNALKIIHQSKTQSKSLKYQLYILQFKVKYYLGYPCSTILQTLNQLIDDSKYFNSHHQDIVDKLQQINQHKSTKTKTKLQLKKQGQQFQQLYNKQILNTVDQFQGFPKFLISKRWFDQWRSHVFLTDKRVQGQSPGLISQLDLLDDCYNSLIDPKIEKQYTNQYLLPVQHVQLTRNCWNFLKQRYDGYAVVRYQIGSLYKTQDISTEIQLLKLNVFKSTNKNEKYFIQISKKQNWKKLQQKLIRIWQKGRIWKWIDQKPVQVKTYLPLQQQNLQNVQIMFEVKQNGKWQFGEDQECNILSFGKCGKCSSSKNLKFCKCKTIKYCSINCLKQHRQVHQKNCQRKQISMENADNNQVAIKYNLDIDQQFQGKKGLVGLKNLGNTCYMNAGLQCLSNIKELTQYFMSSKVMKDLNKSNPLGSSGDVACAYSKIIRFLWSGTQQQISPWQFKKAITKFSNQYQGNNQHDSQQFISLLLDCLHEDINLVKEKLPIFQNTQITQDKIASKISQDNYQKRNKSFISDLITGQFKSRIFCLKCKKVSISFDPFMLLTLQIPQKLQIPIFYVSQDLSQSACKFNLLISSLKSIGQALKAIENKFNLNSGCLKIYSLNDNYQILKQFKRSESVQILKLLNSKDSLFCYQFPHNNQLKNVYELNFFQNNNSSKQPLSYPRFIILKGDEISKSKIIDIVGKGIQRYIKNDLKNNSYNDILSINFVEGSNKRLYVNIKSNYKINMAMFKRLAADIQQDMYQNIKIQTCIQLFTKQQKLQNQNAWYCNNCKRFGPATKKMDIYKTNKILLIGLKRFSEDKKITTKIQFPKTRLNLSNYILYNIQEGKLISYELFGVCNHYGVLSSGHYTAYCKNFMNNKWYEFNDNKVRQLNQDEIVSNNAYVLFYRKTN